MSKNGLNGVNLNVVTVDGAENYTFAPSDTYAAVTSVPAAGTNLNLPDDPSPGDRYEFACVDGSCSAARPISLYPPEGVTIQGQAGVTFTTAYAWGVAVYQGGVEAPGSWMLYSEGESDTGAGNLAATSNATPHTQTAGAAFCGVAGAMAVVKASGVFKVSWHLDWICDTTAENISFELVAIPFAAGTFANGTAAGNAMVGSTVLEPSLQTTANLLQYLGVVNADASGTAANGLTFDGVALNDSATGALVIAKSQTPTLTGLLTGTLTSTALNSFSGSAIFTKATNTKVPYAPGTEVVVAIAIKGTAGVVTMSPMSLALEELVNG